MSGTQLTILKTTGYLSHEELERIKHEWKKLFEGAEDYHKLVILGPDVEFITTMTLEGIIKCEHCKVFNIMPATKCSQCGAPLEIL